MRSEKPVIEVRNIWVTYPGGYTALSGIDLSIYGGEIHVILGENGAGKTTLLKVLSGSIKPTRGEILVRGERTRFRSPGDALRKGISMAYQGSSLIGELTVEENISIVARACGVDEEEIVEKVSSMINMVGLKEIDLGAAVSNLSPAERQALEVLIAIATGRDAVLLDEPTSLLAPEISRGVLKLVREASMGGRAVVISTHKIREVAEFGDRFTVLKKGSKAAEVEPRDLLEKLSMGSMVSRADGSIERPVDREGVDDAVLRVRGVSIVDDRGVHVVRSASFDLYAGEIALMVSLDGRGVEEIAETIYGTRKPASGEIWIKPGSRIGYVPSNIEKASIMSMSVAINASMRRLLSTPLGIRSIIVRERDLRSYAELLARESRISAPSIWSPVRSLSGGNARRLIIWREASMEPDLMVIEEPSANLDSVSIELLKDLLRSLAMNGCAVLIITSDPEDLEDLADRIFTIREGNLEEIRVARTSARGSSLGGGGADMGWKA